MIRSGAAFAGIVVLAVTAVGVSYCTRRPAEPAAAAQNDQAEDEAADLQAPTYQSTHKVSGCGTACLGHEAGYAWARAHNVTSDGDCAAHARDEGSFAQGCADAVQDQSKDDD